MDEIFVLNGIGGENLTMADILQSEIQWTPRKIVTLVIIILFITTGLVGNMISCCVIILYLLRTSGTYVFFLLLSISDTCAIIMLTIESLINAFNTDNLHLVKTDFQCKSYKFFWHFFMQLSAFMTAALTVERYFTLRYFHIIRDKKSILRRAWLIAAGIIAFITAINLHYLIICGVNTPDDKGPGQIPYCGYIYVSDRILVSEVSSYLHVAVYGGIPYIITIYFNIILIRRIRNCQRKSKNRVTFMLLIVTFAFVGLTLPFMVNYIVYSRISNTIDFNGRSATHYMIIEDFCRCLLFINNSFNFLFYMSGRQFRSAVRRLFCCQPVNLSRRSSGFKLINSYSLTNFKDVFQL